MSEENQKPNKSESALREEAVLKLWQEKDIFSKTLAKDSPEGEFVFFDGPPTANGMPGLHHLEPRCFKDAIPRYKTMRGYHVRRKGGWDTHGLPVELQVEKELGLKSKKEIEEYGVEKFNQKCRESVWKYIDEWEKFTDRVAYWVDHKNPYVTYHNSYIESVWNILAETEKKKLLYKDYKVLPWCPRCGTALSSHELAQGYQDDKDLSVTAKFKVVGQENTYFLAWTTTPWTLPGNVGLAVGENIDYVKIKKENDILILAKERLSIVEGEYEIIEELKGKAFVGLSYESLYSYFKNLAPKDIDMKNAYKVHSADFVTTTDGTGLVHTAVMYGQVDFELGTKVGMPKFHLVKEDGHFLEGMDFLSGRFVKDEEVAIDIIKDLAHRGLLFKKEKYEHSYPHCWRCKTPLIYYARDSWYIGMSKLRNQLLKENDSIKWEPSHIKDGRFGEWLREVKDWAISRERYWGTPLPIWEAEDGERIVVDSVDTLKKYTKKSGNKYFVMRHGESDNNLTGSISVNKDAKDHINENGKLQVKKYAEMLKSEKIDFIVSSPFIRTKETSSIVKDVLGLDEKSISYHDELGEFNPGDFGGTKWSEFHKALPKIPENFDKKMPGGESHNEIKKRVTNFLYELDSKYAGKNILIVTHGGPAWLLFSGASGYTPEESLRIVQKESEYRYLQNGEFRKLDFTPLPHNENFELDLHKPFIDSVELEKDGKKFKRVKEVMDVWFDSGAMPFAQDNYPFGNDKNVFQPKKDSSKRLVVIQQISSVRPSTRLEGGSIHFTP
ncbi:class I tRNA ligase family protein [Candidatus Nomurabacteria bacterium]|nr:MAG: class I tRNA ligase family protein [Candidatus Nomurabacteria bacterium]